MKNYCNIGKLVATFGLKGEILLHHHLGKKSSLKGLETLFIEVRKDEMLPYFIETTKVKNEAEIYIRFEGINTIESARQLLHKQVWLLEDDFHKYAGKSAPISLLGFHIIHQGNDLGEVLEVIEQPHQVLCRILFNGKEALIPVHEQTLMKLDKKKKEVFVRLPDGLLDIFR